MYANTHVQWVHLSTHSVDIHFCVLVTYQFHRTWTKVHHGSIFPQACILVSTIVLRNRSEQQRASLPVPSWGDLHWATGDIAPYCWGDRQSSRSLFSINTAEMKNTLIDYSLAGFPVTQAASWCLFPPSRWQTERLHSRPHFACLNLISALFFSACLIFAIALTADYRLHKQSRHIAFIRCVSLCVCM